MGRFLLVTGMLLSLLALAAAGCAGAPSEMRPSVGMIMVGSGDDLGYNQAVEKGAEALARSLPDIDVRVLADVPEDDAVAVAALEDLIDRGASVLLATSYGHLRAARTVAMAHPAVVVLHQGGIEGEPDLPNLGTYFGRHEQPVYQVGIAAGAASRTGTIGYVVAFPIPATHANANALLLGAREVDPDARMVLTFTESWCDPAAQALAVDRLLAAGADVLAQHQDCARTVLEAAEEHGIPVVGFHADGREAAPTQWLTGAVWDWGPLFTDMVTTALRGDFAGSPYAGDYRGGPEGGDNPFVLAEPSARVDMETRALMADAAARMARDATAFVGPLRDVDGVVRVAAGESLTDVEVDRLDWFLEGISVLG